MTEYASAGRVRLRAVTGALQVYADRPSETGRDTGLVGAVGAWHDPSRAQVEVERAVDLAAIIAEAAVRAGVGGVPALPAIDPVAPAPTNRHAALEVAWLAVLRARRAALAVTAEGDRALVLATLAGAVTQYATAMPHPALEERIEALEVVLARVAAGESGAKIRADAAAVLAAG